MNLPSVWSYYGNGNYGTNALAVLWGGMTVYFSYTTIVAYRDDEDGLVVCQNRWSATTGKHLNAIDGGDRKNRVAGELFAEKLERALARNCGSLPVPLT